MSNYPASLDTTLALLQAVNNWSARLVGTITSSNTDIAITATNAEVGLLQATDGLVSVDDEVVKYAYIDTTGPNPVLRDCSRGQDGTAAASHSANAVVEVRWVAAHHNRLVSAIIAVQTELGPQVAGTEDTLADLLTKNLPMMVAVSPATRDWSFSHERGHLLSIQLWRKNSSNNYELFEAPIEQELNPSGSAQVTIDLGAGNEEEGFIVAS